ncbi:hypothetical protein NFI96_032194, partial [Prochilodus magdalenae]
VVEDETQVSRATQAEQDHVRNARPSCQHCSGRLRNQQLRALQEECDKKLISLRDEIAVDLYELEEEYYSSSCGQWDGVELPLCEAFHRRDSWGSPATTSDPSVGSMEDSERPLAQETMPHHLNGHGSSTNEQS